MPKIAAKILTQKVVDAIGPAPADVFHWDAEVRQLGIRVKPSGAASYFVQYRNADNRTRRYVFAKTTALSLKKARIDARALLSEVAQGRDPSAARKEERKADTINDLADYFLNVYAEERRLSKKYVYECKALLTNVIRPRWGNQKVKAIIHDDVRRLKIDMAHKPVRTNRCLALLSKMFNLAIEKGIRADNPVKGIERNMEAKRDRFMTLEELERLMRVLSRQEDQLQANGIRLLVLTGARVGELLSAEWAHFDLQVGIWTKPPSNTKQRRVHRAPLSSPAIEILKRMLSERTSSPFLFPSPSDPMKPRESFRKFWLKVRMEAALGDVVLYTARHTYASHLLVVGVPLGVIGALLGHSQPSTTARYAHVGDIAGKAATEKMGDILEHIRALIARPTDGLI